MIDGEGCVHLGATHRCVQISNTDESILAACEQAARVLGLPLSKRHGVKDGRVPRRQCYTVRFIGGRGTYENILRLVPIQSERKMLALKALVASYTRFKPRPTREWLEDQYVRGLRPLSSIAAEWDMEMSNLRYWMRKMGIPRRTKSEAMRLVRAKNPVWRKGFRG